MNIRQQRQRAKRVTRPYSAPMTFEAIVNRSTLPVLFSFHSPCAKPMMPSLREIAEAFLGQLQAMLVDVMASPHLTERFKVRVIPTLLIFKQGVPVEFIVAFVPNRVIFQTVHKHVGAPARLVGMPRGRYKRSHLLGM